MGYPDESAHVDGHIEKDQLTKRVQELQVRCKLIYEYMLLLTADGSVVFVPLEAYTQLPSFPVCSVRQS